MNEKRENWKDTARRVRRRFLCCLIAAVALIVLSGVAILGYLLGAFAAAVVMGVGLALLVAGTVLLIVGFFSFTAWLKRSLPKDDQDRQEGM